MLRFLRRAHAQVVLSAWRHPTEKRRSRAFAPTIGLTPALEPRHALRLCGPGKKCRTNVQRDDYEEHLAHAASLLRCRSRATAVIMRGCLTLTRSARMSRSSAGSEGRPMHEHITERKSRPRRSTCSGARSTVIGAAAVYRLWGRCQPITCEPKSDT